MSTFADRVREKRLELGLSQAELAKKAGIPQSTIAQIENGRNKSTKKIIELADVLRVTPNFLINGIDDVSVPPASASVGVYEYAHELPEGYVKIPMYDVNLSAGVGNAVWIVRENDEPIIFREGWLRRNGYNTNELKGMYVKGHSMLDTLHNMDTVIINIADTEIVDGEIYAANYKNNLFIKEIRRHEDGIYLISRNKDYGTITVSNGDCDLFQILGKMVWRGG